MALAAWQHSTAAINYGKVMSRGGWRLTLVVADGNGV
jgi:hypothetical protein